MALLLGEAFGAGAMGGTFALALTLVWLAACTFVLHVARDGHDRSLCSQCAGMLLFPHCYLLQLLLTLGQRTLRLSVAVLQI